MKKIYYLPIIFCCLTVLTGCSFFYDWPPIVWNELALDNAKSLQYQFATPADRQYYQERGEWPDNEITRSIQAEEKWIRSQRENE